MFIFNDLFRMIINSIFLFFYFILFFFPFVARLCYISKLNPYKFTCNYTVYFLRLETVQSAEFVTRHCIMGLRRSVWTSTMEERGEKIIENPQNPQNPQFGFSRSFFFRAEVFCDVVVCHVIWLFWDGKVEKK